MGIRRIVPDLQLEDAEASKAFYGEVLGLELGMDMGWVLNFVAPGNPTAQVILIAEDATAPVRPEVTIEVDDLDAAHDRAVAQGCEIVHPVTVEPWGVRRFFVRDPNGVVVNVVTHVED